MMLAKPKHARLNNVSLTHPPSQALLSTLAIIATFPPVVAGAPLHPTSPPAFLCPFIERDNALPHLPTSTHHPKCDVVADKFIQGSDSLWRKTDGWTLYGSTCWVNPPATTAPVQPQTTPLASTPTTNPVDLSVLPAGWGNATNIKAPHTDSDIILAIATVLAGLICIFMIGCVIWRRQKKKTRDAERKLGRQSAVRHDAQNSRREDDPRGKMRMWAKATARWKSNTRQSARRRRKTHRLPSIATRPLSPTLSDSPRHSLVTSSTMSRRGSIAPEESNPSGRGLCCNSNVTEPPAVHDSPCSLSPPTYGASFVPRLSRSSPSSVVPNPSSTPSTAGPYSAQPSSTDDDPLPYVPPSDGHVATDDKSLLAYFQQLASSPPIVIDAAGTSTIQPLSAPEWYEVEGDLEDFDIGPSHVPTHHDFGLPPSFPPPPSKTDLPSPFHYLNDYPDRYGEEGDVLGHPCAPGSPRPSLGAFPSAPPMDDPGLEPSAPFLESGDEDWDGGSSHVPEVLSSADLNSTPIRAIGSSISSTVSRPSFPSIPESAGRDGMLPRYQP